MTDIVERLQQIANSKLGDPMPECMRVPLTITGEVATDPVSGVSIATGTNDWATPLSAIAQEAINEIKRLRALVGAASEGPSFRDVRDEIKGQRDKAELLKAEVDAKIRDTLQPNKMPE